MESDLARTEQRLNTYRLEIERTRSARNEKELVVAEKREQAEALEQKRQALEDEMKVAQQRVVSLKTARDEAAQSCIAGGSASGRGGRAPPYSGIGAGAD